MIEQKIGSVVKLVSGGPDMTIVEVGSGAQAGSVRCEWYDASAAKQSEWYPADALMPAPRVGGPITGDPQEPPDVP